MVLKKLAKHNRKTLNQPILELYKAGAASYGVPKKKPLNLDAFLGFGFLRERIFAPAALLPSGQGPQRMRAILPSFLRGRRGGSIASASDPHPQTSYPQPNRMPNVLK